MSEEETKAEEASAEPQPEKSAESPTVECKAHGASPWYSFNLNGESLRKVCFLCWMEKATEGLENFS